MRYALTIWLVGLPWAIAVDCSAGEPEPRSEGVSASTILEYHDRRTHFWSVAFSPDDKYVAGGYTRLPDSFADQGRGLRPTGVRVIKLGSVPLTIQKYEAGDFDLCTVISRRAVDSPQTELSSILTVTESPRRRQAGYVEELSSEQKFTVGSTAPDGEYSELYTVNSPASQYRAPVALAWNAKLLATFSRPSKSDEHGDVRGEICLWDLGSGKQRFRRVWESEGYHFVAFSPDGEFLAVGGGRSVPTVIVLNNGERIVGGGDKFRGRLQIWNTRTGDEVLARDFDEHLVESVTFSPDGKTLVTGGIDGRIAWWDIATGEVTNSTFMERPKRERGEKLGDTRVHGLAFSLDGRFLAASMGSWNRGGKWGELRIYDSDSKEIQLTLLRKHPHVVTSVAFSSDGKLLAAGTADGFLCVWDIESLTVKE